MLGTIPMKKYIPKSWKPSQKQLNIYLQQFVMLLAITKGFRELQVFT